MSLAFNMIMTIASYYAARHGTAGGKVKKFEFHKRTL